jgi:4-methyl-5(b-hydroxyethyl)-thiazole monophosphate biosynthesis
MILADFFEDVEGLGTLALLRRSKVDVDTVSVMGRLELTTQYQQHIVANKLLEDISWNEYDFLVIPGGKAVRTTLSLRPDIDEMIKSFHQEKKIIAAICAAPGLLGKLGLLDGKNFTCFPGVESDILKGVYRGEKKAVIDGLIITGRSAGSIYEFSYEIVKAVKGEADANQMFISIVY